MITLNPAKQLGIDDRVGSLEVAKDGDIAIFDNHPLPIYAVPQMTFVDGVKYFDIENDQRIRESTSILSRQKRLTYLM